MSIEEHSIEEPSFEEYDLERHGPPFESFSSASRPDIRPSDEVSSESRLARRYRVIIHNDEQTPMDFVVRVLTGIYRLGIEHAIEVMLEAHGSDCAFVRAYGLEEAEFRVQRSHTLARSRSYPLTFTIESE